MRTNDITFILSIFFLPIWLVWELVLLKWRGQGINVDLISMVMKNRAYEWNFIPFFWASMMSHWWFNWLRTPVYDVPYFGILFWLIMAGTLVLDVYFYKVGMGFTALPNYAKVLRAPMIQCAWGALAAYVLFPQRAIQLPGWRWW